MPDQQNTGESTLDSTLTLEEFGVSFSEKVILGSVNLQIPDRDITCLIGPSGTGKSTLLRTLAGFNDSNPNMRTWGSARYCGEELGATERRPKLVMQSTRLLMSSLLENLIHDLPERSSLSIAQQRDLSCRMLAEAGIGELESHLTSPVLDLPLHIQRLIAIIRLNTTGTRLLFLDEPTTGLEENEAELILNYLTLLKQRRSILIAIHHQAQARKLGGQTALLAGGNIQEAAESRVFFNQPESPTARQFVRTGSCSTPSPDANPEDLAPGVPPPPPLPKEARKYLSDSFGPRGFLWLIPGKLAGTPKPGIFFEPEYDLKALHRVGVRHLVSLMEEEQPPVEKNAEHGLSTCWFAITDMAAPTLQQAVEICRHLDKQIFEDNTTAVHCKAGMGRTGTILAAYLIWKGQSAFNALENTRKVEPRWVQSRQQVAFLERFESHIQSLSSSSI